jgi:hypothetical protein
MGGAHRRILGALLILGWIPIAYSLLVSWPSTQVPQYLALADHLKLEAKKFDKQNPGSSAAAEVAKSLAQFDRWKQNPGELETLLWRDWLLNLVQLVLGITAGVLLVLRRRTWTIFGTIVSVWYLYEHNLSPIYGIFLRGAASVSDIADRIAVMSKSPGLFASVVHFDLVLPLLCLWTLFMAAFSLLVRRGGHAAAA